MEVNRLPYDVFKAFPPLVEAYLNTAPEVSGLYSQPFSLNHLKEAASKRNFNAADRKLLSSVLEKQYSDSGIPVEGILKDQLEKLGAQNTFTITTGHQLCLFSGPLYFIIKIIQAIKMADSMNEMDQDHNYVPVFWMASEDHDFEEINHSHVFGKTLKWQSEQEGAVGEFKLNGINDVLQDLNEILGDSENAGVLKNIFKEAYAESENLSVATRKLVHSLFGQKGLVILDANNRDLKNLFIPQFKKEIEDSVVVEGSEKSIKGLVDTYKIQVNPRDVNIFYLESNSRKLIEKQGAGFTLKDGNKNWSSPEILKELEEYPERFSPNVVLRPMYQERILPNICYIGGSAEIAYWLQLKSSFEEFDLEFPLLSLRNSVMWLDKGKVKKLNKLDLGIDDLFLQENEIAKKLVNYEEVEDELKEDFQKISDVIKVISSKISDKDPTLKPVVEGEGKKIQNQLEQLNKRLIRSVKSKNEEKLNSFWNLHEKVFPGGNLHERYDNFVPYYLSNGTSFFDTIYNSINPEDARLIVIQDT